MTWLLPIAAAVAADCADAEAAWAAHHTATDPTEVSAKVRVIVGSMLDREGDDAATNWLSVSEGGTQGAWLALARHHQRHERLKSAVIAARTAIQVPPQGPDDLLVDQAAIQLVGDVYFDLGRYSTANDVYANLDDGPLGAAGIARRSLGLWDSGDEKGAAKALRAVRGWKSSEEPDVIWARHMLGLSTREEALAALDATEERLAAVSSVADAQGIGGIALHVGLAPDVVALACLARAHPDDPALAAASDRALGGEVDELLARVTRAREGVEAGQLPALASPEAHAASLRQDVEALILLQDTAPQR